MPEIPTKVCRVHLSGWQSADRSSGTLQLARGSVQECDQAVADRGFRMVPESRRGSTSWWRGYARSSRQLLLISRFSFHCFQLFRACLCLHVN